MSLWRLSSITNVAHFYLTDDETSSCGKATREHSVDFTGGKKCQGCVLMSQSLSGEPDLTRVAGAFVAGSVTRGLRGRVRSRQGGS